MNFSPHHKFSACEKLEARIEQLKAAGAVSAALVESHSKYHYSLIQKLRAAKYHAETLKVYLATQDARQADPHLLLYRANFHFDGFLHSLGSAMDILARELLGYFGLPLTVRIYYWTAATRITAAFPGDPILPLLDSPNWKDELNEYRNTATHESVISTGYKVEVEIVGKVSKARIVFAIPDDPRNPISFKRNTDISAYCEATLKRVLSRINQLYEHIEGRAKAKNALPL
jgi:hypothetical protein